MAITVSPYNPEDYNSTPLLGTALGRHNKIGGNTWVHQTFGPLFRQHKVDGTLGLVLLHHHFQIEDGEYLTEVRGTSTAWKSQTGSQASSWMLDQNSNSLKPLEFAFDEDDHLIPYPDWSGPELQQFLEELKRKFEEHRATGVYGLGRYPGDGFPGRVEMTVGRSNVNLTPDQAAKHDPAEQSEAAWYFTPDFTKRGCACNCYHHGTDNSSHSHHQTVTA